MLEQKTKLRSDVKNTTQIDYFEREDFSPKGEKEFSLSELLQGIFSKLYPLFSIDCSALILYNSDHSHITRAYLSEANQGIVSCVETISDPVSLSLITTEIAAFEYPVLKSREDWIADFGENHCLVNHPTEYYFHCYIPIAHEGHIFGTFELHNHNKELSADGLTFCCNIADFIAGWFAVKKSNLNTTQTLCATTVTNVPSSLVQLTQELATANNLNETKTLIESYFLTSFEADYAELIVSSSQNFVFDTSILKEFINQFEVKKLNEIVVKQTHLNLWVENEIENIVAIPLVKSNVILGQILIGFKTPVVIDWRSIENFNSVINVILLTVKEMITQEKNELQAKEIAQIKDSIAEFIVHTVEEPQKVYSHPDIIGSSSEMQEVYKLLNRISSSDATILILGETGTGKELIAKAVHDASSRKQKEMIKVNCAAIPPNLIESELFGHERGSFTGATERRIGKFEQAHKGTIFLDEIGELTLDLQVKLLRVLQEKEIERVGGKTTIATDVRIISATNRDLLAEIEAGRFRRDLYYRLNVFPVSLPSLRDRKDDIPLLAHFFLKKFAEKSNRNINGFSKKAIATMTTYSWPGNVRELEHLVERHVVMSQGQIIRDVAIPETDKSPISLTVNRVKNIFENERDHIFSVLALCKGKISGKNGAAKLLGIPATTLNSKMKRLGLEKKHIF